MGSQKAFAKLEAACPTCEAMWLMSQMYTGTAGVQIAKAWAAHGKPKGFWLQASFLHAGYLHLPGVKLTGPPTWLAPVSGIGFSNGFCSLHQLVEMWFMHPLVHHLVNCLPIFLVPVVDKWTRLYALPCQVLFTGLAPLDWRTGIWHCSRSANLGLANI